MRKACKGGPAVLFVATGERGAAKLTSDARALLRYRNIELHAAPTPEAVGAYNTHRARKAIVLHLAS